MTDYYSEGSKTSETNGDAWFRSVPREHAAHVTTVSDIIGKRKADIT